MFKHTQTIRRLTADELFECVYYFERLALNRDDIICPINPFHATDLFLYPLKTENQTFYDIFRGYRKKPLAWNALILLEWNL